MRSLEASSLILEAHRVQRKGELVQIVEVWDGINRLHLGSLWGSPTSGSWPAGNFSSSGKRCVATSAVRLAEYVH